MVVTILDDLVKENVLIVAVWLCCTGVETDPEYKMILYWRDQQNNQFIYMVDRVFYRSFRSVPVNQSS